MSKLVIMTPNTILEHVDYYDRARYKFIATEAQQQFIQRQYAMNSESNISINMQFFQSANMLNGNSIKVTYQYDGGGSSILDIDCTGSFYSMKDFNAWLIPLLQYGVNTDPLLTQLSFAVDNQVLQNQGIESLYVKNYHGIFGIQMEFFGYQLIQTLGMDYSNTLKYMKWINLEIPGARVKGQKQCFMPVVKQLQVCCSLQKDQVMCDDGILRHMIGNYVNSIMYGDWAAMQENIPISPVYIEDLLNPFYIDFYDQNFILMPQLMEMRIIIQIDAPEQDGKGIYKSRILTNRGLI